MVLEGSIASLGSQYVLGLRARNCNTGNILDQEQIQAARREDVLNSLSEIVRKLRTRLGESRATVEKHSTPLADATTPSLEALKAYSTGMKVNVSSGTRRGHTFFPARRRNRSQIRHGVRESGACVQRCRRVGAVGREHDESVAIAGSRQRSGEVFHRLYLRPAGDGKSGEGVPDPRVVASDLSSRARNQIPRVCSGAFPPTGPADSNERSRHPEKRIAADPDFRIRVCQSCIRAIFSSTVSTKPRACFNEPPNASWKIPIS